MTDLWVGEIWADDSFETLLGMVGPAPLDTVLNEAGSADLPFTLTCLD